MDARKTEVVVERVSTDLWKDDHGYFIYLTITKGDNAFAQIKAYIVRPEVIATLHNAKI